MQKHYSNILEFTKVKETCLFCQSPLRAVLTNFIGPRKNGIPIINAPLKDDKFIFDLRHTTETYSIEARGIIDINTNVLKFEITNPTETPTTDQALARQAFGDLKPHVELYCPNKRCDVKYNLCSDVFTWRHSAIRGDKIMPLKLYLECFKTGKLNVQNDCFQNMTFIYSIANEDADPISVPMLDFEEMGRDKLLVRIKTLVVWS